ncbi:hypothetical protein Dda_0212 [Drechslerella dactyloides]|uniref:Uncharacterized protein n=1 Tax=Drechslerella dactyloides TaxID=74499 RepID=A0AAD6NLQ9_DREDA|nr:hypothetical protein Dda_0212 [Drechslerella dactyloides]
MQVQHTPRVPHTMAYRLSIAAVLLAVSLQVAARPYDNPMKFPDLSPDQANQCNLLRESGSGDDLRVSTFSCFYQDGATNNGVDVGELSTFLTRNWTMEMTEAGFAVPGNATGGCQQIYCLGEHASLSVCNIHQNSPPFAISGIQLHEVLTQFRDIFSPEKPWESTEDDPATFSRQWVKDNKQTFSCCTNAKLTKQSKSLSSDRHWGILYKDKEPGVQFVIQPVKPVSVNGQVVQGTCDVTNNLVPEVTSTTITH